MNPDKQTSHYGVLMVFVAAMLWASDAPFRVLLSESLNSSVIVLLEHVIALVVLTVFFGGTVFALRNLSLKQWLALLMIGIGGSALALILFTESFSYMNPSVVILLQKLQPLMAIVLAVVILKERIAQRFWLWAIVALGSAYVISFPTLAPELYPGEEFNPHVIGVSLALGAGFLWATATVMGKYLLKDLSFETVTYARFLIATIFLLLLAVSTGSVSEVGAVSGSDWLFLGIIALISGVAAMYIYYRGLKAAPASAATIAELGFPVAAVVVNYIFLDEALVLIQVVAMAVLIFAVFKINALTPAESN